MVVSIQHRLAERKTKHIDGGCGEKGVEVEIEPQMMI